MLNKNDILWKRDGNGKFVPEEVPVEIYDRNLDAEIRAESLMLDSLSKKTGALKESVKDASDIEKKRTAISILEMDEQVKESRDVIAKLKEKIEKTKKKDSVKVIPCTVGEMTNIQNNKSLDGKEVEDVIAHLIHKKCKEPLVTYEEAKDLPADMRIAIKDAIVEYSGYKAVSYREEILDERRSVKKKNI